MSWQLAIILQILVSAFMTVFTRQLSLTNKKVFFGVGVFSYVTIAGAGWIYALLYGHDALHLPPNHVWPYLLIEGVFIPASWLALYKLISHVGAGNAVIVTTLNTLGTAVMGIAFLNEKPTLLFLCGAALVVTGVSIALRLKPDSSHTDSLSLRGKILLTVSGVLLFSIGMYAEKVAVSSIGVWDYAAYGWTMQAVGAILLYALFGRKESTHVTPSIISKGIILGLITSLAGILYIYALSKGTLSQTVVATSGKAAVVMILAALLLHERNALSYKFSAFLLTVTGLWLILA